MATKNSFTSAFPGMPADFSDMGKSMTDAVSEMQSKAQAAYEKGTGMVSEMTDLAKGNVEALVESGKIVATGLQDMGKTYADEAKSAYETISADLKEMASVKSPTELFQLQGKIMRRNFDMLVATGTKGSEGAMKLANEAIAPISARVNLAVEKLSKAA
ncbi:phasin family protein [Altererythrobacter sp. KTW20L]|nr:phasin family protein [Altererythrobacter sp. KTW20L]